MKTKIDHADIVVTHFCSFNCPNCIDKFKNDPLHKGNISTNIVEKFLDMLKNNTEYVSSFGNEKLTVLLLGGEPTHLHESDLTNIAKLIKDHGFSPHISTNGVDRNKIKRILNDFDWVQITVHSDEEIEYWRPYKDKVNIKISGDKNLTYEKLINWMNSVKDYPRRSVSMYIDSEFENLCSDNRVWELSNTMDFQRLGSYEYAFYKGIRFKKCIKGITNIVEEPLIPKLYPNGNYNKTWNDELLDDYIDGNW